MSNHLLIRTLVSTSLALCAFAANSVLCRLALGNQLIDAPGFSIIRLLSGSLVLLGILIISKKNKISPAKGSWTASIMLFVYVISFSYAYISLDTGTGALILFASVQITMILTSLKSGSKLHLLQWLGLIIAFTGFVYLVLPSITSPSLSGFILMTIGGIAWAIYTLKGYGSKNPLMDTSYNFLRTTPMVLILALITFYQIDYSLKGVLLAVVSGGITSGIGYTLWYIALTGLSPIQAAVLQLSVPVIAALGGAFFVSEEITFRLIISALMLLGGILLVILGKKNFVKND